MAAQNNYAFSLRIGASHDEVKITDKRTGKAEVYDRAALASYDKASGSKPWNGHRAKVNELVTDAWAEDRGLAKAGRADKRQRDAKHKAKRRSRQG